MVGLLAEHAQQGAQALGAEPRGYELIVRWDRAMCSFLGSPYCGHPPEILITTALTITPGLLQRGRARESAEINVDPAKLHSTLKLQRGRARESAEICLPSCRPWQPSATGTRSNHSKTVREKSARTQTTFWPMGWGSEVIEIQLFHKGWDIGRVTDEFSELFY